MISDGYVKYEEAEVHKSASMQDFEDNKKKNGRLVAILDFIRAKFSLFESPLCETLFYTHGPAFFFSYVNITKLLKFKMATKRPF